MFPIASYYNTPNRFSLFTQKLTCHPLSSPLDFFLRSQFSVSADCCVFIFYVCHHLALEADSIVERQREDKKEEATLCKPPLNVISRKTTTIARVGPAWNGSTSWWRSYSDLTKGNSTESCIYSIHDKTRLRLGRGDPRESLHIRAVPKCPVLKFFRFSIFYGFPLFATSRCWCWCCFAFTVDAIWYLKLLSLLVMFVKFFICWQRSRWYLRQSAIWISALFLPFAGSLTSHLSEDGETGKRCRVWGGEINVTNTLVGALTATFDNLTISCRCSSVKVLWLLLFLPSSARKVAKNTLSAEWHDVRNIFAARRAQTSKPTHLEC